MSTMDKKFRDRLQWRIGSTSVGASTARGMGPKGTILAATTYLQRLDLRAFKARSKPAFLRALDNATRRVVVPAIDDGVVTLLARRDNVSTPKARATSPGETNVVGTLGNVKSIER